MESTFNDSSHGLERDCRVVSLLAMTDSANVFVEETVASGSMYLETSQMDQGPASGNPVYYGGTNL